VCCRWEYKNKLSMITHLYDHGNVNILHEYSWVGHVTTQLIAYVKRHRLENIDLLFWKFYFPPLPPSSTHVMEMWLSHDIKWSNCRAVYVVWFYDVNFVYGMFMNYCVGGIFIVPHLRLLLNIVRIDKILLD